jgi:predicted ATPase
VRLVTLTGPGGSGKTRLGLQLVGELLDLFPDGILFVDLAPVTEPALVPAALMQTLRIRQDAGPSPVESLMEHLGTKRLLLLLDNFEHLLPAAPFVAELLAACPQLKVLVTSRTVLRLRGEHEFPVPPLALPDRMQLPPIERLTRYAAVELFIQRAVAAHPAFAVTDENAAAVVEICHRLDGLPLAIELAAARLRLFTPASLLARLDNCLKLLTQGACDLPARQRTLRDTIAWSHDLLSPAEQKLFRCLAVFVGGATMEAAEAVCSRAGDLEIDILGGVASLVDRNLLRRLEGPGDEPRFTMLEAIREYGLEQLQEWGETERVRRQHAELFLRLAEDAEAFLRGPRQVEWMDRLEREHDNLRAALDWCATTGEAEMGLRLSGAVWWFWQARGYLREGHQRLRAMLALPAPRRHTMARAKALIGAGALADCLGDYVTALACHHESLSLSRECGDQFGTARALLFLGMVAEVQGDYTEAHRHYQESLALHRTLGEQAGIATSLSGLGNIASAAGQTETARAHYHESLAVLRELEDIHQIACVLSNLGDLAGSTGDYDTVWRFLQESLTLTLQQGDRGLIARVQLSLGTVALNRVDLPAARQMFEQILVALRPMGEKGYVADAFRRLGKVALWQGNVEEAEQHGQESLTLRRGLGNKACIADSLDGLAEIALARQQTARAIRLNSAAAGLREHIGAPLPPFHQESHDRHLCAIRDRVGEAEFAALWAEGQAMSLEQAIKEALGEQSLLAEA